jgi:cell fate regulator YaaT (PSP1 superfamily)
VREAERGVTGREPAAAPEAAPRSPDRGEGHRNIAGVKLTPTGRSLEHDAGDLRLYVGDRVVVDDRRGGTALGIVSVPSARRPVRGPLGRVLRRAEPRDLERQRAEEARRNEALAFARDRVRALGLPIKVFRAELPPGADRALFYFSSEQRVDFRELVKDLAGHVQTRIELRQVGVRDEAKMVGGIGSCGRELCCSTFLVRFSPVSIRAAKSQNLALNPSKITGQCGRLKCCLVYEEAQYVEAARELPRVGRRVDTADGPGRVEALDVLAGLVRVSFPDKPPKTFSVAELAPAADGTAPDPTPAAPDQGAGPDGT